MKTYKHPNCSFATVVEIAKEELLLVDFAHCLEPTETLESFYKRQSTKPSILINGGFFNTANGVSVFNFIDEKATISNTSSYKFGMGITNKVDIRYGNLDSFSGRDFISGYPPLIDNGKQLPITFANEINYNARRTVLGYNDQSIYILVVDLPGLNFSKLEALLIDLKIKFAINLDGGGSSRLLIDGVLKSEPAWSRPIDNVVAIYLKPAEVVLYRVQVGAFSVKANADKMKAIILALPDEINAGYKNAYVRLINGLYKVQVGAFSVRGNAEKVLNDLVSKSIQAFITT
jgi:hypothetical protein